MCTFKTVLLVRLQELLWIKLTNSSAEHLLDREKCKTIINKWKSRLVNIYKMYFTKYLPDFFIISFILIFFKRLNRMCMRTGTKCILLLKRKSILRELLDLQAIKKFLTDSHDFWVNEKSSSLVEKESLPEFLSNYFLTLVT